MALFKNKWEIKTWADLSASVADASNALEFRPVQRLPYELQQGSKAAKKVGGFFKKDSILKSDDYPTGFYIYDTASGLTYTATPKDDFKNDMTEFLNSSSLSSAAKSAISTSFNGTEFPSLVVQIDSGSFPAATASWDVPCAFIGDTAGALVTINNSTNSTNIKLQAAGVYISGSVSEVEFTLPIETMSFTGTFASRSLKFASFSGSEYTPVAFANSAIYTPHGQAQTTASIIGELFGSGSFYSHPRGLYDHVNHGGYLMALGDDINTGSNGGYTYGGKLEVLHFPAGSTVASASFTNIYDKIDTNMTGSSSATGSEADGSAYFWDNTLSETLINNQDSGSHVFADAELKTPAAEGIYTFSGATSASLVIFPTSNIQALPRVPRFSGFKY